MIYTDRKHLLILTLTENRDYVTYDELIHILTERPSSTVYIERGGILCGIVSTGDILRKRDDKTRRVPSNKEFTSVRPEEYLRARQIFKDIKNINMLPVVSEDGYLLGEYARWSSLIGIDHAELLCKDPYVLQGLKAHIQNTFFVEPVCAGEGRNSHKMFSWWRQRFENEGIHLQIIQRWEIEDHCTAKYFVFVDEDERNSAVVDVFLRQKTSHGQYVTITEYLYCIDYFGFGQWTDSAHLNESVLKKVQDQGVHVLAFGFQENGNQFLAVLQERIRKRNEEYGVNSIRLPEALKESFADELYCEAYKTQSFPLTLSLSFYMHRGIPYVSDAETEFFHIRNGERLTVDQPEKYDRCIYLYGPCNVFGVYVSDQYTIPSLLQGELNQAGFSCKVINRGFPGRYACAEYLQSGLFKQGDILVIDQYLVLAEDFPILNLTDAFEKHDAPADWFCDEIRHCNHKANQVSAHEIYKALIPVLQSPPPGERNPVKLDFDYIDRFYLGHYFSDFDHTRCGTIGAIVMNCNPFTFGHRFLIEEALKTVDFLIVFVVEEDESLFSFQERFAMVCQGTSDLEHIMVVPSGPYILSKSTFPEYFEKISDEDLKKNTEDDITFFAEKIAPRLGITYRFVGEEREDRVTNEYNKAMKRILPLYGIQLVEIPRKANYQTVISASRVRYCLSMNCMEELNELVPASTKRILFYENT